MKTKDIFKMQKWQFVKIRHQDRNRRIEEILLKECKNETAKLFRLGGRDQHDAGRLLVKGWMLVNGAVFGAAKIQNVRVHGKAIRRLVKKIQMRKS